MADTKHNNVWTVVPLEFVIDPAPRLSETGMRYVHVTAIMHCGPRSQLQLYRIIMYSSLDEAIEAAETDADLPLLDTRLLNYPLEDVHYPYSLSSHFHSGPPLLLHSSTRVPQLYRMGTLQSPDPEESSLRILLPAEQFDENLLPFEDKAVFRLGKRWAAFWLDYEPPYLHVQVGRLSRRSDSRPPQEQDAWHKLGFVPHNSIISNLSLNVWRGTIFITALPGNTYGEVRMYEVMDTTD